MRLRQSDACRSVEFITCFSVCRVKFGSQVEAGTWTLSSSEPILGNCRLRLVGLCDFIVISNYFDSELLGSMGMRNELDLHKQP